MNEFEMLIVKFIATVAVIVSTHLFVDSRLNDKHQERMEEIKHSPRRL